jgi:hypothetical protein
LMRKNQLQRKELIRNSVSIWIDLSILSQECTCTEFSEQIATMLQSWNSEEETVTPNNNNGTSIKLQRQSSPTTGKTEDSPLLVTIWWQKEPTQDGSNFSDTNLDMLSMKEERSSIFQEELIQKTEMLFYGRNIRDLISNGTLSTLMNFQPN